MRTRRLVAGAAVLVAVVLLSRASAAVPAGEYQIKSVFLFNFVQFAEWPDSAFPHAGAPFTIGVLGDDPFGAGLDEVIAGESIGNRRLVVRRSRDLDDLKGCQLLFVSRSERDRLQEVLNALGPAPILTVSDIDQFAARGGMIGFYLERNRVRFEINAARTQRHGLRISSQLLSLGRRSP